MSQEITSGRPGAGARFLRGVVAVFHVLAAILFFVLALGVMFGILFTIVGVVMGFTEGEWATAGAWAGGTAVVWLLTWGVYRCTSERFRRTVSDAGDVLEVLEVVVLPFRIIGLIGKLFD